MSHFYDSALAVYDQFLTYARSLVQLRYAQLYSKQIQMRAALYYQSKELSAQINRAQTTLRACLRRKSAIMQYLTQIDASEHTIRFKCLRKELQACKFEVCAFLTALYTQNAKLRNVDAGRSVKEAKIIALQVKKLCAHTPSQ